MRGINEGLYFLARFFIGRGGPLAQEMHAAVNVGVLFAIIPAQGFDDRLGLLTGSAVVEVDQRLAMDAAAEDGKITAHVSDIEPHAP